MSSTASKRPSTNSGETPTYSAPALDKGLDILELLSATGEHGLTQTQIAQGLGRSQSEFYRMLTCLVQRGYLQRGPHDENYRLTAKLFELAHRHPPTRRLIESALPAMRVFSEQVEQSCHLVVHREHKAVVIAHVDSPSLLSVSVRPGAMLLLHETVSGRVLAAFEPDDLRDHWIKKMKKVLKPNAYGALIKQIQAIRQQGYDRCPSTRVQGVLDLSVPVLNHDGFAVAALSVPCLVYTDCENDPDEVLQQARQTAAAIGQAIGAGQDDT